MSTEYKVGDKVVIDTGETGTIRHLPGHSDSEYPECYGIQIKKGYTQYFTNTEFSALNVSGQKTYIDDAPGKGRGIFANCLIQRGEIIEIAPIIIIPKEETDLIQKSHLKYYWFKLHAHKDHPWSGERSALGLGHTPLYNHDDNPNAIYDLDGIKQSIQITARRTIKKGEEITFDYGYHPINDVPEEQHLSTLNVEVSTNE